MSYTTHAQALAPRTQRPTDNALAVFSVVAVGGALFAYALGAVTTVALPIVVLLLILVLLIIEMRKR